MVELPHKKVKKAETYMDLSIRIAVNGEVSLGGRYTQLHEPNSIS